MAVTKAQIDGFFKHKYGPEIVDAVPNVAILQDLIPFEQAARTGDEYRFPVLLRRCHGMTWAGGANAGTAYTLNDPESMLSQEAQVSGSELTIQEDVAYGVLSRAAERGERAFEQALKVVLLGLKSSSHFWLEEALLYGNSSIGAVAGRTNDSGTVQTFQLTKASCSMALLANLEGARVDVYNNANDTIRNTTGTLKVTAVDPDLFTITLTGDAAGQEGEMDAIDADDYIVPIGAKANGWMSGIDKIASNTGTLLGIAGGTYNLWLSNSVDAGTAKLTMAKVQKAVTKAVGRGLSGHVVVLCSPYTWTDLNNNEAALKRYAMDTKTEFENGANGIVYHGVNNGKMEIIAHPLCKASEAFVFKPEDLIRLGSSEPTHRLANVPGMEDGFYQELESKAGIRLRCFWDQGLIHTLPAQMTKITGIVNDSHEYTTQTYV